MMKAPGLHTLVAALLAFSAGSAHAEDKDKSGRLLTWNVTKDGGDAIGVESVRLVESDSGMFFASGELKLKTGKKPHRKSHLQRDGAGKVVKYQRVEAGLKGAGWRLFEWQGQMRLAPINAAGKPVDLGALPSGRIWDEGLWHLYQTWGLPKACDTTKVAYFDLAKRATGEASLRCVGTRKVYDDKKKAVEVHRFEVGGVDGEAVELWVDSKGELIGGKSESRQMLRAKFSLEPGKEGDAVEVDDEGRDAIKDRGVGE
jgi:hypothetical protein